MFRLPIEEERTTRMVGRLKQIKGRQDTGVGLFQLHPSLRPPPDKTHCTIIVMVRFCLLEKWVLLCYTTSFRIYELIVNRVLDKRPQIQNMVYIPLRFSKPYYLFLFYLEVVYPKWGRITEKYRKMVYELLTLSNLCLKFCHLTFNLYNLNIFQTAYFVERAVCN